MQIENFTALCDEIKKRFDMDVDLNGILFLVGIRERGWGFREYSKEEKMSLLNLGSCVLFQEKGMVEQTGTDEEGWPQFRQKSLAATIPEERKIKVLQDCAILYFNRLFE